MRKYFDSETGRLLHNHKEGDELVIRNIRYYVHIGNDDEMRLEEADE